MTALRIPPPPDEAARVTARAGALLEAPAGSAPTATASTSQVRLLLVPEQHDGVNLRTLAGSLGTTAPAASRLCARLQTTGFVERVPGAADRREVRLGLGGSGRSFRAQLRARRQERAGEVPAAVPSARRGSLLEGLEAFCATAAPRILGHEAAAVPAPAARRNGR
ncbi:DNA-binding transcriptional regulator, MarR family [Streptomyces sp. 2231.1]|uniref:MarR family transcriptional regulator n=1 Tax=Streptomyces sp. 2231.1 TaxID=1855347 RepID=UPI00089AA5F4|nr:MarR family transcriptional regulator [Streptomyces sp. 2231.1]SEE20565.1 DNA-binding transcriptional regulator, MarR family [Streptomyces sp. 2231.1]